MKKNFNFQIKVYYEDTDARGVVYYANYLKFLERARSEAIADIGFSNQKIKKNFGLLIIVKSCNLDFRKSAYLEDILKIKSSIISYSKTSLSMNQIIFKEDDIIVNAKVHLVFINEKGKPNRIPEEIITKLKPYLSHG